MQKSGQLFFSVRALDGQYYFEDICGIFKNTVPFTELQNAFPSATGEEIIRRCALALSGESWGDSFTADLGLDALYSLSLVYREGNTCFFQAHPLSSKRHLAPDTTFNIMRHAACFYELCDGARHGVFIWHVTPSGRFLLAYANEAYKRLAGITHDALGKTPEELYAPDMTAFMQRFFEQCVQTGEPVICKSEFSHSVFSVHLYPRTENGRVVHIMGTSVDITEMESEKRELARANQQLSLCEDVLRQRLQFEELISKTTRDFMDAGSASFDTCLRRFIAKLRELLQVSSAFVIQRQGVFSSDNCPGGARLQAHLLESAGGFDALAQLFTNGRFYVINDLQQHKSAPFPDYIRTVFAAVRSVLAIPILRGDELRGVMMFTQFEAQRIWSTGDVAMAKVCAETIMSAYLRIRTEKQLNESNRVLAEYDDCLQEMLAVQETLAKTAQNYTTTGIGGFDACTNEMLKDLGDLLELDAALLYVCGQNTSHIFTYRWHRKGLPFQSDMTPQQIWSALTALLENRDTLAIGHTDLSRLPIALADHMVARGIKSLLILPVREGHKIWGYFVLSNMLASRKWTGAHIDTVKTFAGVFLGAYLRKLKEEQLLSLNQAYVVTMNQIMMQMNTALKASALSQELMDATADTLLPSFSRLCKELAPALNFEAVSITRFCPKTQQTHNVFEWTAPDCQDKSGENISHSVHVPLTYQKRVWGRFSLRYAQPEHASGSTQLFEPVAQHFMRAYMRVQQKLEEAKPFCETLNLMPKAARLAAQVPRML